MSRKAQPPVMSKTGKLVTTDEEKAEVLNDFSASVFNGKTSLLLSGWTARQGQTFPLTSQYLLTDLQCFQKTHAKAFHEEPIVPLPLQILPILIKKQTTTTTNIYIYIYHEGLFLPFIELLKFCSQFSYFNL